MDCNSMFKCLFNIGENEIKIYKILLEREMRVGEIVEIVRKDRSTIQRCLKKLMECGMVKREKKIIEDGGGYYYVYSGISPNELKEWLQKCIERWYSGMKEAVENLEKII
ncbi:MAG: ArsR family transcriptional regulator [Thermoplasmata archaeon]|nr:ArsR family transcriptional regulator [Thermoplasmata archaeon]